MAIILNDNVYINAGKPSEPKSMKGNVGYANIAEALAILLIGVRHRYLVVNIVDGTQYWFKDGVADVNLVRYMDTTNFLEKNIDNIIGNTSFNDITAGSSSFHVGNNSKFFVSTINSSYISRLSAIDGANNVTIDASSTTGFSFLSNIAGNFTGFYSVNGGVTLDTVGGLAFTGGGNGAFVRLKTTNVTFLRNIDFPNASGTLALLSDLENNFRGTYISLVALQTAIPTGNSGNYAIVDSGAGSNAQQYIWDAQEGWVAGSGTGGVSSFKSRVGNVMPQAGDYDSFYFTQTQSNSNYQSKFGVQAPNTFYRGPASGASALPTFGPIVASDIPATTVVAGSYTNATIVVGLDGRVYSAASGTSYTPRGQLFSVSGTQWGTSAVGGNFIVTGAGPSYTFNSNNLTISGGTNINNFISYSSFSFLNDWTATLTYIPTLNTAGVAMSWGRYASGAGATNYTFWLDNTVSSASVLKVLVSGNEFPVVFNDNKINVPNGATVTINVTECKNKFIFSVEINNGGVRAEQLVEYEKPFYSGGANSARSSWGIVPVGGTSVISSFGCYSRTLIGVDLAIVGDSYLEGLLSLNEETTLGGILEKRTFSRILTYAKGGATTQDLVDCQAELLSLLPKNVYLNISANQIAGSPTITFNLMKSVADALTAQGCNVYVGKAYVRGNVTISDLMVFNNLIDANYPSERVVDCYTPFLNAAGTSYNPQYKDVAGTHFNLEGNRLYADICWSKFKTFLAPSNNYEPEQTYFNKYLSKNTLISYPTFVNSKVPPVAVLLTAATSSQTTLSINFAGSLTFAGYDKGYAKINNGEIVLITGVDDINNRLFVTRGQLGTTPTAAAIGTQVAMFTYVLATPNGPQHLIDNGGYHIIKGVDVFVTSVSTIYAAGTNNILSLVNNNAGNGGGESNLQISRLSSSSASRIRLMTGTTTNYEIALNTSNDFQINRPGNTDFYLSAGMTGFGCKSTNAYINIKESTAAIAPLKFDGCTLALSSVTTAGGVATFVFAVALPSAPFKPNSSIVISGSTPTGYNTSYSVINCSTTQFSVSTATTGVLTVNGVVRQGVQTTTLIPGTLEPSPAGDRLQHTPFGATFGRQTIAYLSDIPSLTSISNDSQLTIQNGQVVSTGYSVGDVLKDVSRTIVVDNGSIIMNNPFASLKTHSTYIYSNPSNGFISAFSGHPTVVGIQCDQQYFLTNQVIPTSPGGGGIGNNVYFYSSVWSSLVATNDIGARQNIDFRVGLQPSGSGLFTSINASAFTTNAVRILTADNTNVTGSTGSILMYAGTAGTSGVNGNIAMNSPTVPAWQGMVRGMFVGNATAIPTGNPVGGGYLYVESGALKYRGSSGTVTILGIA